MISEEIQKDIVSSYGSLANPNWAFASRNIAVGFHDEIASQLKTLADVDESTDLNDDVARCLSISDGSTSIVLWLSLVGQFACAYDVSRSMLTDHPLKDSALGAAVGALLKEHGFVFLGLTDVNEMIHFNGQNQPLFRVLFSDDEYLVAD